MKKIPPEERKTFDMIVSYLQAGGDPKTPFILRFCQKHEIKHEEFVGYMASSRKYEMMERLRLAGLI